jgi:predicted ATPase
MAIDRIYINNFKSIRELNDFPIRSLNVLIGSNGAGKSNFIAFFKLLNSIATEKLPNYVAENSYADKVLYFGKKVSKERMSGGIVFKTDNENTNTNNRYDFILKADGNNGLYFENEKGGYNLFVNGENENWDFITLDTIGSRNGGLKGHNATRFVYLRENFEQFKIYHFHDTSSSAPLKQPSKLRDNDSLREDGSNIAAFLYWISQKHISNFKLIEYAIRSIAPFFDKFDLKPDKIQDDLVFLSWLEKNSDEAFDANNFSDGSIRFIALATVLLQPNPPKTIIIDEPELGLHPSAINKLASMIKMASAKSQIIISTQSVNLLDQFEAEDIIVVDRKDNQSVFKRLDKIELENWINDYNYEGMGELWSRNVIGGTP